MPEFDPPPPEAAVDDVRQRWRDGTDTLGRIYGTILGITNPTSYDDIAEVGVCSPNAAKRHLDRLSEMGIARADQKSRPARSERNDGYLEWQETSRIAEDPIDPVFSHPIDRGTIRSVLRQSASRRPPARHSPVYSGRSNGSARPDPRRYASHVVFHIGYRYACLLFGLDRLSHATASGGRWKPEWRVYRHLGALYKHGRWTYGSLAGLLRSEHHAVRHHTRRRSASARHRNGRFDANDRCQEAIETALDVGYRHIDTAQMYGTEGAVGNAVAAADVDREEVLLTTKLDNGNRDHDSVIESTRESLDALQVDTVDLLLIHSPNDTVPLEETIGAMNELQDNGTVAHIGVSNFSVE